MAHSSSVLGPFAVGDDTTIAAALSNGMVVADDVVSWVSHGQVWFGIVTA